jgi:diaminopimelate decarboxylase
MCTGGELAVAQAAGFPAERIGMHGNNKSVPETGGRGRRRRRARGRRLLRRDRRLAAIAREAGARQRVLVRATVGVEAHTHEFIATAH